MFAEGNIYEEYIQQFDNKEIITTFKHKASPTSCKATAIQKKEM